MGKPNPPTHPPTQAPAVYGAPPPSIDITGEDDLQKFIETADSFRIIVLYDPFVEFKPEKEKLKRKITHTTKWNNLTKDTNELFENLSILFRR